MKTDTLNGSDTMWTKCCLMMNVVLKQDAMTTLGVTATDHNVTMTCL